MVVMLNGSFGIGKSTVANLLCKALPGSAVYDPEWAGYVLRRLPRRIKLTGSGTDDYQDIQVWRRSVVWGVRLFQVFVSGPVIVPMTFSRREYFDEVVSGLRRLDPELRVFCLQASLATVKTRLLKRGAELDGPSAAWVIRRITECVDAHRDTHFGEPVNTEEQSAHEVAQDILARLQQSAKTA